ncbi:MAG: SAM-dependent methyltransferase [Pseudomonadota bacterium]
MRVPTTDNPPVTGYLTKLESITGNGEAIHLRSLLDRQQFHDPLGEAESLGISSAAWPIFGLLWPSGRVLAHAMVSFELEGKRILELGCGLALASLVVHRRGGNITASDCHPLAAVFLADNVMRNHLPVMKYETGHWNRANPALGRFDLIIGSDLLYDRDQPQALSQFIDRHSGNAVEILLVDPDRGNQGSFSRKMGVLGYSHTETRITRLPEGAAYKGRLHNYQRSSFVA